jgi:xylulokinase
MDYILALDLGTTALKIMLFQTDGVAIAKSSQEYTLITPTPLEVELPVETYWTAFKRGLSEVLATSGVDPAQIKSIGLSVQGETLIAVDEFGQPLMNAIVWLDNRAQAEAEEMGRHFEFGKEDAWRVTGQVKMLPIWPASKILWIKRNAPDVFRRTAKFLMLEDYFIYRLTGKYVCEGSLICTNAYWDFTNKVWWKEMLDYLSISEDRLPEIKESGEVVGSLRPEIALELGLSPETLVATGGLDQACGAIGVGNIKPGIISVNTGAALAICAAVDEPFFDAKGNIPCHYHVMPDTYFAHTCTMGGGVLRWFRDSFCQPERTVASLAGIDAYDLLNKEAAQVLPGCDGMSMLPHLQGAWAPEFNPKAKGVFYGLTLHHTRPHFVRAIMEAVAFAIRRSLELLEDLGIHATEIRSLGGGSRSQVWGQIKADVIQRPVYTMKNEEAGCLGAAMLAGVATGVYGSVEEAVDKMVVVKDRLEPNSTHAKVYDHAYEHYVELYESLLGLFDKS